MSIRVEFVPGQVSAVNCSFYSEYYSPQTVHHGLMCAGPGGVVHRLSDRLTIVLYLVHRILYLACMFLSLDYAGITSLLSNANTKLTVSNLFIINLYCVNAIFNTATHPCKTAICPNGTKCEVDSSSGIAHCQPSCDINNGGCPQGSECSLVNATVCFAQPCLLAVKCSKVASVLHVVMIYQNCF